MEDDIDMQGIKGTDNSHDYNDDYFNDTIIVDDEVVSALSLAHNAISREDQDEVGLFF